MSQILGSLKFVQAKRIVATVDAAEFRRQKMLRKIDEQIALANQFVEYGSLSVTRTRRLKDSTGQNATVEVEGRARPWWFTSEKGSLCLSLRYGSRVIELSKGRNAIEVGDITALASTLETVKRAVVSGEMDAQIAIAADAVKARFKKR